MINKIKELILEIEIEINELNKLKDKLKLIKPNKEEYTKITEQLEMCANRIKLYLKEI